MLYIVSGKGPESMHRALCIFYLPVLILRNLSATYVGEFVNLVKYIFLPQRLIPPILALQYHGYDVNLLTAGPVFIFVIVGVASK